MQVQSTSKWISYALLALMLLVQTAAAGHDIEHQSIDHTELCQAFVTADHAPAIQVESASLPIIVFAQVSHLSVSASTHHSTAFTHCARAPPQN